MPEVSINGVSVVFPFEPYDVQRAYMEKVIECLNCSANGVLESPTGTGKTLSLLCSSLGWISMKKHEAHQNMDNQMKKMAEFNKANGMSDRSNSERGKMLNTLIEGFHDVGGKGNRNANGMLGVPKVIYASRTHSQISQAIQELKRTAYNHMKAAVIGSRDQLCIHPDLEKESNANKIQLCKLKVNSRTCHFHNRLEGQKDSPEFREASVLDIEDIVGIGKKLKCCPYYASKELMDDADIVFMPYNYLLDPKIRKANKVDLHNTIIILDEAHNVEKMCEESASVQVASSEIAVAIEDVSSVLIPMIENGGSMPLSMNAGNDEEKDFTTDDLVLLKEIFLNLEKVIDEIPMKSSLPGSGETFEGGFIFALLEKANINQGNSPSILATIDALKQFLLSDAEAKSSIFRRGAGLDKISELLSIVFSSSSEDFRDRVGRCYKVYVETEQPKQTRGSKQNADRWIQPKTTVNKVKPTAKVVNYWCFSPGFGMQHLLGKGVRSIILTSGTLAPLKPLISELDIPISVNLENPHIVNSSQVCVKIISQGSDKESLNSNYENRNNPKYINSLGRTILAFCPVVPHGLLVFFPSYFILNMCKEKWQEVGLWSQIQRIKPIFIEPTSKEAFLNTMQEYYEKINDPHSKGAIFMAVCRGKVSEGLDFADMNGRAVIITGLPFPPYKDPKIVLKKKYLSDNRTKENQLLSGDEWYFLEASRAVNQAIGRVIRHKNDYGAILLCDCRFNNPRQKNQLSSWIQGHLQRNNPSQTFGSIIGEVARFFKNAERTLPLPTSKPLKYENAEDVKDTVHTFLNARTSTEDINIRVNSQDQKPKGKQLAPDDVKNANDTFSWDIYGKPAGTLPPKSKGSNFFSRLDDTVKTIDFNNMSAFSNEVNSSQVKIHKRERSSPDNCGEPSTSTTDFLNCFANPKRKKLIVVANNSAVNSDSDPVLPRQLSPEKVETTNSEPQDLPSDRKELLKLIKFTLNAKKYGVFLKTFEIYNDDGDYKVFIKNVLAIFSEESLFYILKGMVRFVKTEHKKLFEKDVVQYILNRK